MLLKNFFKFLILASLFLASTAQAADISKAVTQLLKKLDIPQENVRLSPAKGLYELQTGAQIFYITADGKYLLTGNMVDMTTKENLTDTRMKDIRLDAINAVEDDQLISYKAKNQKYQVTVFTDIDCGYCRKLHSEIDAYNKLGISVKYLFYPRAGPGSESYNKAVSVWCNKDRNLALTDAKAGKTLAAAKCANPVARHYQLGTELGVTGTPYMITDKGDLLPGYVPPAALKLELEKMAAQPVEKEVSKR